jgi:hypothetical protein
VLPHQVKRPPGKQLPSVKRDSGTNCDTEVATDRWAAWTEIRKATRSHALWVAGERSVKIAGNLLLGSMRSN